MLVVIDPIDGSLNAKRGLPHHAISIAVADGPTMADVAFGFVHDFGPGEEWTARRGEGAWLDGAPLTRDAARAPRAPTAGSSCSGSSPPTRAGSRRRPTRSCERAHRLRALGTIAVDAVPGRGGAARRDGHAAAAAARSTPPPAQLIVREARRARRLPALRRRRSARRSTSTPRSPVVAARTPSAGAARPS